MTSSISPLKGRTSSFSYDAFGRPKSETKPGTGNTVEYDYKLGADCVYNTGTTARCEIVKPASGGEVITHFDYAGREIRRLHKAFNGRFVVRDTTWDRNGRKKSVSRPKFVSEFGTDALVTFEYDVLNRETGKSEPAAAGTLAHFKTSYNVLKPA